MKRLIFLFGVMAAMFQAWSQNGMPADTLQSVTLEEVKVTRSAIVDKSDRKLLIPTEKQLRMSSNGVDLLRNMQMPMLTVDIVNDQIKLSGNGSLAICINGREADIADVKALDPRTVKRIEFHESPSMRYGGVDGVIDYIVEQPTSGGSFVASGQQSYVGWGNYNVSGKFNKGNSQFGLYGNFGERYGFTNWRDNEERYQTLDGQQFTRTEKGLPGTTETPWYAVALDYGYSKSDKMLFVAQAKFRGNPGHVTEFNGELANSYSSGWQRVFDRSAYDRIRPSLDLYWQRNMQHGQSLMLNVVGTYDSKQSEHFYRTENHGISQDDADLQTVIDSRSYSLIANGNYEKRWDIGRLTTGIRYSHGWGDNDYLSSHVREKTREGKTLVYAEWWQPIREKFDYKLSIAGKQRSFRIAGEKPTNTFDVIASLETRLRLNGNNTLRLGLSTSTNTPDANDLTSALQDLDEFQKYRGNPALKPYRKYKATAQYELAKGVFFGRLKATCDYYKNPVMEDKYWVTEGGETFLLNTLANQRSMMQATVLATVRVAVVPDWLTVAGNIGWERDVSKGLHYEHRHSSMIANWDVMLTYRNFALGYAGGINQKYLWGETIHGDENYQVVQLSYKWRDWNFAIGIVNPFMDNYNVPSENLNRYGGYTRKWHVTMAENLGFISISYAVQWGRKAKQMEKRLNNSYDGGAIGTTGK